MGALTQLPEPLNPTPIPEPAGITLQDIADFAAAGKASLEEISRALTKPIDQKRFNRIVRHIDLVCRARWRAGGTRSKATFQAEQNRRKGKLFESLVGLILDSSYAFRIYGNVQTLTNEIDWLVYLAPLRILMPAISEWGTHFICECKMSKAALDGNWVNRLYALTQTHGTKVAVLFTAKEAGNKGGSGRPLRAIQDLCIIPNGAYIIRINLGELQECVNAARSPLVILEDKYVALRSRRSTLSLISA